METSPFGPSGKNGINGPDRPGGVSYAFRRPEFVGKFTRLDPGQPPRGGRWNNAARRHQTPHPRTAPGYPPIGSHMQVTVFQFQMGHPCSGGFGTGGAHTQLPQPSDMKPVGQQVLFSGLHAAPLLHAPHVTWPPHWSSIVVLHAVWSQQFVGSHEQVVGPMVVKLSPQRA